MDVDRAKVEQAEAQLYTLLGPELAEVTDAIRAKPSPTSLYLIEIPDAAMVDLPPDALASLVARTANAYGRVCRFAGMARAEAKLAKGRYERIYKRNRTGRNEDERSQRATEASEVERLALDVAEAISEMADALESAARIASESARKLLDKVAAIDSAERREEFAGYRRNS